MDILRDLERAMLQVNDLNDKMLVIPDYYDDEDFGMDVNFTWKES